MALTKALASRITGVMLWLAQPVLVVILRGLVRSREFWKKGLSNAWHSRDGISDELLDAYRLPQLVKGWEIGLVRFVRARVAGVLATACATVHCSAVVCKVSHGFALQTHAEANSIQTCNYHTCETFNTLSMHVVGHHSEQC